MATRKNKSKAKPKTQSNVKALKLKKGFTYRRHRAAAKGLRPPVDGEQLIAPVLRAGRPSMCKPEIYEPILERIANGESLIRICSVEGMPDVTTVQGWRLRYPEFDVIYRKALQLRTHTWGEQALDIADTPVSFDKVTRVSSEKNGDTETVFSGDSPEHRKLQVDTRFKMMKMHNRDEYGDKLETENKHEHNVNIKKVTVVFVEPNGKVIDHV